MNLESILPLLMKNSDPKTATLMSALNGDRSKMFETILGKDEKNKDLFNMINMMQSGQKKTSKPTAEGLKAIYNFAPKDILGIMVKYYSKYS